MRNGKTCEIAPPLRRARLCERARELNATNVSNRARVARDCAANLWATKRRLDVLALRAARNDERKGRLENIEQIGAIWRAIAQHGET